MPTGYTAAVQQGTMTELRDFILTCARGMGGLIDMRDAPPDAPIPDRFEPRVSRCDEELADRRTKLVEIHSIDAATCLQRQEDEIALAEKTRATYVADKAAQADRYQAMILKVEAWETEAEGVKEFALSQLRESLEFDCGGTYEPAVPAPLDAEEWRDARAAKLTKEIDFYERMRSEEVDRVEARNRWLAALKASLPEVTV